MMLVVRFDSWQKETESLVALHSIAADVSIVAVGNKPCVKPEAYWVLVEVTVFRRNMRGFPLPITP